MVQPFKVITTSPTNFQFGYVYITTDTQLSTQVSFHIQRVGRFRHTDQQWWVIVNGSPKTFNYNVEGNYSDQHLISLVLYTCYSISHVCFSSNMAGASPITWPLTSCENTLLYNCCKERNYGIDTVEVGIYKISVKLFCRLLSPKQAIIIISIPPCWSYVIYFLHFKIPKFPL